MTYRLGLISDVHASPGLLAEALDIFRQQAVDDIICAGDIAGYHQALLPTIRLLAESGCKTIIGNHDQSWLARHGADTEPEIHAYLHNLPQTLALEIEGKRLFAVHANPPSEQHGGIKLRNRDGELVAERMQDWSERLADFDYDVLIVGHTHQVYAEQLGGTLVINPGSVPFNFSCMLLSLPDLAVQRFALGGREIIDCWNFGMLRS